MSKNNTGIDNSGYFNSGDFNSGDFNSGYFNSGDFNSGDFNSGNCNSGNCNSGDFNSGDRNSGYRNSGYFNSGDRNSGYRNSGYFNSGDFNSGDFNSGYFNSGDFNSGDFNSGWFNTNEPKMRFFNKDSSITYSEFIKNKVVYPDLKVCSWVSYKDLPTDEQTTDTKNMDGKLKTRTYKEAWKEYWGRASEEDKKWFQTLPNFDAKIFEEITGINVGDTSLKGQEIVNEVMLHVTGKFLNKISPKKEKKKLIK